MTIDEMIAELKRVREESPLKGDTVVVVCLEGSGISDSQPTSVLLDTDPHMKDWDNRYVPNGVAQVFVPESNHEVRE